MFGFFKNVSVPASVVGLDIGTTSIKMVELARGERGGPPRLVNYGILETAAYLERFNTAIQASSLNLFEREVVSYLQTLVRRIQPSTRRVIASLPTFSVFTTLVEMPAMSEEEMIKAMNFHVKQYIPMAISSVTLDWFRVGERADTDGNKKIQVLLIAIPSAQIETYKRICSLAGMQLAAVEVEGLSIARALGAAHEGPTLVLDIGARSTALLVIERGMLKSSTQTDFAGASLTQSLASGLSITIRRAEELKRQKGLSTLNVGAERELSTQILPILDVILNEARRAKDAFETTYRGRIANVVLTGGGANLLGIEAYVSQELQLPTTKIDPLAFLRLPESVQPLQKELGPRLAVAIGLALRDLNAV